VCVLDAVAVAVVVEDYAESALDSPVHVLVKWGGAAEDGLLRAWHVIHSRGEPDGEERREAEPEPPSPVTP
jgi:hypothetical protein